MRRTLGVLSVALLVLMGAGVAQAANQLNLRFSQPSTVPNPCTNELVDSDVKIHIVINGTVNPNNASETFHLNFSLHGVGRTTGAHYTGSEADNEQVTASVEGGRTVITVVNRFNMTTPGRANNWVVRLVSHVTINASGEVTASFEKLADGTCR